MKETTVLQDTTHERQCSKMTCIHRNTPPKKKLSETLFTKDTSKFRYERRKYETEHKIPIKHQIKIIH